MVDASRSSAVPGRWRTTTRRAALLAVALGAALLAFEVFLRALDYAPNTVSLYRANPAGGGSFRLKPNLKIVTQVGGRSVTIATNSHGMRWPEVAQRAEPGVRRVAMVGDSFTFGLWADSVESTLAGIAAASLQADGIEVLNFGVPGYGLLDVELQIQQQVLAFGPSDMVLTLYNGNDFLDTYLGLDRYRVTANGSLQLDEEVVRRKIPEQFRDGTRSFWDAAREQFRLFLLLSEVRKRVSGSATTKGRAARSNADSTYTSNIFWSQSQYPGFAEQARRDLLEALGRIKASCDERGMRLFLVALPSIEQVVDPGFFAGNYEVQLPQKHFEEFARAASIPYLDLLPPLSSAVSEGGRKLHLEGDGHFNNAGHEVSGELIAAFIKAHTPK